jgi:hypothetical protein
MGSPTLDEEVAGQFEDAESDDDASPSFVSKPVAPPAASQPAVAARDAGNKDFLRHGLSATIASAQPPAPGGEPSSNANCLLPASPSASTPVRGSSQPRLVGSRTNGVFSAPTSHESHQRLMKPTHAVIQASGGGESAVPDPPSWSPYYRPIAPRGGIEELVTLHTPGYRSSWASRIHATPFQHSIQPLPSIPSRTTGVRVVLASGDADAERIDVETCGSPTAPADAESGSQRFPVPVSRKASIKQVVLGVATGKRNGSFAGVAAGPRASAVVDAAHAMTELCRQSPGSVPPSVAHPSSAFYLQMAHPHPSIAPRIPSFSRIEDRARATELPSVEVESDFEDKERPIITLSERDILMGRGGQANHHAGNRWFRNVIQCYRMHYCVLVKGDKMQMARNLANWFYLSGARFLLHDDKGCWYEAGANRASKKCSQSLREGTCTVVRKTLEGSIMVGADAAVAFGPGGAGSQSNTVTPTLQIEERDASSKLTRTNESQSPASGSADQSRAYYGERKGSTQQESYVGSGPARNGAGRPPKRSNEGESNGVAKKWDNWRKRPRESTG